MGIAVTHLGAGQLSAFSGEVALSSATTLYQAPNPGTGIQKAAMVQAVRLTNIGSATATVQVYFLKSGGTVAVGGDRRRILAQDLKLPAGFAVVDDNVLTLGPGDSIHAYSTTTGATVDFSLSGVESTV